MRTFNPRQSRAPRIPDNRERIVRYLLDQAELYRVRSGIMGTLTDLERFVILRDAAYRVRDGADMATTEHRAAMCLGAAMVITGSNAR